MIEIEVNTKHPHEILDITKQIEKEVSIENGIVTIYTPHTTAAIIINEGFDENVKIDLLNLLSKLIPKDPKFKHSEGNSDAHIKSSVIGNSRNVIIEKGKLILGRWEKILFCEFDGPRRRKIWIQLLENQ